MNEDTLLKVRQRTSSIGLVVKRASLFQCSSLLPVLRALFSLQQTTSPIRVSNK